tara:strand:+ start:68 stop:1264 length:1197 start_codon:yes stop_codon:yes gene_type:complete
MAETDAPMFQSTRSMKREMDEILSEKQDPVSGNVAPVGATPEEVRDDIPIMASPNEFMIDAATRRYYGTPFFENLQAAAKQGFQRIKKGEESFFRDDELEVEEAAEKVTSGGSPQQMQEGGEIDKIQDKEIPAPVGGGFGAYGGTGPIFTGFEYKIYIDPETGREIQIIFFNGRPLSPIPEGFILKGDTAVEVQKQKTETSRDDDDDDRPDIPRTWENKPASKWTAKDFQQYASDMSKLATEDIGAVTAADRIILGFVGNSFAPGLGLGLITQAKRIKRMQAKSINNKINDLLSQGVDADGNPLTDETNNILFRAQQAANQQDANAGGMTSSGVPITDQPFYQTESGEIDYDALMPPGVSDDDDDDDLPTPDEAIEQVRQEQEDDPTEEKEEIEVDFR